MKNLNNVEIKFEGMGDYGLHDFFFNAIAKVDGIEYDFQCCSDDNKTINLNDCGYDEGICKDVNEKLANVVGWDGVLNLIKKAYREYTKDYVTITQDIMDVIDAEIMNTEGTHVGYDEDTKEDEVVWNDVYVDIPQGQIQVDFTWYGDYSPNSEDGGRWEYSVKLGDKVELV